MERAGKMALGSPSVSRTSSGTFDVDREHSNYLDSKV